jgi:hypothetical protein
MAKINQIVAVTNGRKARAKEALTALYHKMQRTGVMDGISRTYRPKDDEGEQLPPESRRVQLNCDSVLETASKALTEAFDSVATVDKSNTVASADVVVDGVTLLKAVPTTTLLYLEKQLVDMFTLVNSLPALDPAEEWEWSDEAAAYASTPAETVRTKKVPRHYTKAEATKEHPAQVEMYYEDICVGHWRTVKFSGALPEEQKRAMLERVRQLQDAVKTAREAANNADAVDAKIGKSLFDFLFPG